MEINTTTMAAAALADRRVARLSLEPRRAWLLIRVWANSNSHRPQERGEPSAAPAGLNETQILERFAAAARCEGEPAVTAQSVLPTMKRFWMRHGKAGGPGEPWRSRTTDDRTIRRSSANRSKEDSCHPERSEGSTFSAKPARSFAALRMTCTQFPPIACFTRYRALRTSRRSCEPISPRRSPSSYRSPCTCRRWSVRATATAVAASISTPVFAVMRATDRICSRTGSSPSGSSSRDFEVNLNALNRQRMTQRNQFAAAFGGEDAGDAGGVQHFTLGHRLVGNRAQRVAACIRTKLPAAASRHVVAFCPTSTICALPCSSR